MKVATNGAGSVLTGKHWAAWTIAPFCSTEKQHVTSVVDSESNPLLSAVQVTGVLAKGLFSSQKIEIASADLGMVAKRARTNNTTKDDKQVCWQAMLSELLLCYQVGK